MPDRILLVSPASPFNPRSGAQQRTALLHEALKTLGDVDVLLVEPTAGTSRVETPKPGILAHGYWHQPPLGIGKFKPDSTLGQALETAGVDLKRYRLVVSRYLNPLAKLAIPAGVHTVVDLDDWGYHYGSGILSLSTQFKSRYAAWLAERQLKRFDAYFFVSRSDQAQHRELKSVLLPNIPYAPPSQPFPQTSSPTLLFVGSLWYAPNREGIERFLSRCWPDIKASRPEAKLLLIGAAPPRMRQAWEKHPDVSAPGFVDDLGEAYRNAAFTIAPIYSGGGTNIKILESLAYGRACITTPHSAHAFGEELGNAGLGIARDDSHFVEQCVAWLDDRDGRGRSADAGWSVITTRYTRPYFIEQVAQLCAPFL